MDFADTNKKIVCVTSYAQSSGVGTPMFSRPGRGTTAEYLAFKESLSDIEEREEEVPEEVQRQQLVFDLQGEEKDARAEYLEAKMAEQEELAAATAAAAKRAAAEAKKTIPLDGNIGNSAAFRSQPREHMAEIAE